MLSLTNPTSLLLRTLSFILLQEVSWRILWKERILQIKEACPLININKLTFPVQITISILSSSKCLKPVFLTLITLTRSYWQESTTWESGRVAGSWSTQTMGWPRPPCPLAISFNWLTLLTQSNRMWLTPQPKILQTSRGLQGLLRRLCGLSGLRKVHVTHFDFSLCIHRLMYLIIYYCSWIFSNKIKTQLFIEVNIIVKYSYWYLYWRL